MTRHFLLSFALLLACAVPAHAETCKGRFLNPINDMCWECVLPIEIAPPGACVCPAPPPQFLRFGLVFSFTEPVWMIDVTREPFCFTNLDLEIDPGFDPPTGRPHGNPSTRDKSAFYQSHVLENFFWAESFGNMISNACKLMYSGGGNYSVEWITELDPLWSDDELAFVMGAESALFANNTAQLACAADCVAATVNEPIDALFWCAGCQGSIYPLDGHTSEQTGGVMASNLLAERLIAKMHRQSLAWDTTSNECSSSVMPIVQKSNYKTQITYPLPRMNCPAFGASEIMTASGQEFPYSGEDFGYLVWRKRRCCISN